MEQAHHEKTVLIVDGDAGVLAAVSGWLTDSEYNILIASGGEQGLRQSREFRGEIDLLLADLRMPGMSGVELATAMSVQRPQLKVLLMSGLAKGTPALNEGWHFLAKPFVAAQLRALVVSLVSPVEKSKFSCQSEQ